MAAFLRCKRALSAWSNLYSQPRSFKIFTRWVSLFVVGKTCKRLSANERSWADKVVHMKYPKHKRRKKLLAEKKRRRFLIKGCKLNRCVELFNILRLMDTYDVLGRNYLFDVGRKTVRSVRFWFYWLSTRITPEAMNFNSSTGSVMAAISSLVLPSSSA